MFEVKRRGWILKKNIFVAFTKVNNYYFLQNYHNHKLHISKLNVKFINFLFYL